jgi:hypothetical protein
MNGQAIASHALAAAAATLVVSAGPDPGGVRAERRAPVRADGRMETMTADERALRARRP